MEKNFIDLYLDYTFETESPRSFHVWTAISVVAAVLQRKVWINFGHEDNPFTLYPNLYVVFVAPPGRCRKTQAIRYGEQILAELGSDISVASDSITREALIQELEGAHRQFTIDDGQALIDHCSLTVVSGEFSVFLGQKNFTLLSFLCDVFDCKAVWKYSTKHEGKETLYGVWFSILGATTKDLLLNSLPLASIGGGLTSRMLFIVEDKRAKRITSPYLPPEIREQLVQMLRQIYRLQGEMKFAPGAFEFFDKWYQTAPEGHTEFDEREHIYVLKVAMIVAAAHKRNYIVIEDLQRALDELAKIKDRMEEAYRGIGRNPLGMCISKLQSELRKEESINLNEFLRLNYNDISQDDIVTAVSHFERTGEAWYESSNGAYILHKGKRPQHEVGPDSKSVSGDNEKSD